MEDNQGTLFVWLLVFEVVVWPRIQKDPNGTHFVRSIYMGASNIDPVKQRRRSAAAV